jgi:BMFP domain-containing protein YqiC
MSDRKQPTPIDADEYDRFVNFVRDVHDGTRGHLRKEIENALRDYRESYYEGDDRLLRIEDDVASIKALLADVEGDGGTPALRVPDADARTHAYADSDGDADPVQAGDPDGKPPANASRTQKVAWLAAQITGDPVISPGDLRDLIRDEYGFQDRTVDDYVDLIIDELDAERHPIHGKTLVWADRLDEAQQQAEEQRHNDADAAFDRLDVADRED